MYKVVIFSVSLKTKMPIRKKTYRRNKIDHYNLDHNIKSYSDIIRIGGKSVKLQLIN